MVRVCVSFLLIIGVSFLFFTGLTIFTRGFLLKRSAAIDDGDGSGTWARTNCEHNWSHPDGLLRVIPTVVANNKGCWLPAIYKKAVIILIDGLRFDFVNADRMPVITELLSLAERGKVQARLYRFVADPPTTTMQRIKALVTGGLPTFIEAGRNFGSTEINEDNIIDGLIANGKKVVFMGDDTWMGLMPARFNQAFPFPSFNVRDLDTVDTGITERLLPMLTRVQDADLYAADWDVIVAHFLGVDHCGHTHGPDHPEMIKKLLQMNDIIRSVTKLLDDTTVLFVFGDHGMTKTGDHGGDSTDEIDSALFIFSQNNSSVTTASIRRDRFKTFQVNQIDFAPTFALLLGIPIPFGNLGTVIDELFNNDNGDDASALYLNVKQLDQFVTAYGAVSDDFASRIDDMRQIKLLLNEIEVLWRQIKISDIKSKTIFKEKCIGYLNKVQKLCRDTWAKFDVILIMIGISITTIAVFSAFWLAVTRELDINIYVAFGLCGLGFLGLFFSIHSTLLPTFQMIIGWDVAFATILVLIQAVLFIRFNTPLAKKLIDVPMDVITIGACLMHAGLNFSNSYVVTEDSVTLFLLLTLLVSSTICSISRSAESVTGFKKRSRNKVDIGLIISPLKVVYIGAAVILAICLRLQTMFWKCREEQWWCVETSFIIPQLSSIESHEHKSRRILLAFLSVAFLVFVPRWLLRRAGNLNGYSFTVLCSSYLPIIMGLGTGVFWASQALNKAVYNAFLLPNIVLVIGLFGFLVVLIRPLSIYEAPNVSDVMDVGPIRDSAVIVPQMFRHLKSNWQNLLRSRTSSLSSDGEQRPLVVYGLATAFSSAIMVAVTYIVLFVVVLSRDQYAISFVLVFIGMGAVIHCSALSRPSHNGVLSLDVSWCWVIVFNLLSSSAFYSMGHQHTFPTLHWESAAIGVGDVDPTSIAGGQLLPALKVVANTFGTAVVFGIALPLLIVWKMSSRVLFKNFNENSDRSTSATRGEFDLLDNNIFDGLTRLLLKYITLQGIKLLSCMAAAALHRRHLMVWKIFAPRFLYEAVNFVTSVPAILIGLLTVFSVERSLRRWMDDKEKYHVKM